MSATATPGAASTPGFDRDSWRREAGNQTGESRRGALLAGARAAGLVTGASRDSIHDLLGPPDSTRPGLDIWYLGRSSVGPSFESLHVRYDAGFKAKDIRIARS
jgi:hypothetical protein